MFLCLFVFSVLKLRSCFVYSFIGLFKAECPPPTSPRTAPSGSPALVVSSSTSTTPAVASSNHQSISLVSFHYLQHSMSGASSRASELSNSTNNKQFNKQQFKGIPISRDRCAPCSSLCSVFGWDMNLKVKVKLKVEFARTTLQQGSCYNILTRGGDSHFLWIIWRENFLCQIQIFLILWIVPEDSRPR